MSTLLIPVQVSVDSLRELKFSWFLKCQLLLDCILEILNIILWDLEFCLNPVQNVDIFILAGY